MALPISTLIEFWQWNPKSGRNYAVELIGLYPHMLLIPPMLLWVVLWLLGSALSLAWEALPQDKAGPRRRMKLFSVGAAGIATLLLVGELRESPVLLVKLSPHATNVAAQSWNSCFTAQSALLDTFPVPEPRLDEFKGQQKDLRDSLQYEKWRGRGWSFTRVFYGTTFFISIFTLASLYLGLAYARDLEENKYARNQFITLLVATAAAYAFWFPARFYFNSQIKAVVFGSAEAAKGGDLILCLLLVAFGVAALILNWTHIEIAKNVGGVITAIIAPLAAFFTAPSLGGLIGSASGPYQWVSVLLFIVFTFYLYSRLLAKA
jgi:hypothetical protein